MRGIRARRSAAVGLGLGAALGLGFLAIREVETRVTIDGVASVERVAAYAKAAAFLHRHREHSRLAAEIVGEETDPEARAREILAWTRVGAAPPVVEAFAR
jgi:hypothetical protein